MLEKLIELYRRNKAKESALAQIRAEYEQRKKEVEEEFGDTDAAVRTEKSNVMQWMIDSDEKSIFESDGSVEIRDSAPKYKIVEGKEEELIAALAEAKFLHALSIKKSEVNALKKKNLLPDDLVKIEVELELAVTTTWKE